MQEYVEQQDNYLWTSDKLNEFVYQLKVRNIKHLHLYPSVFEKVYWVEKYFLNAVVNFVKD